MKCVHDVTFLLSFMFIPNPYAENLEILLLCFSLNRNVAMLKLMQFHFFYHAGAGGCQPSKH